MGDSNYYQHLSKSYVLSEQGDASLSYKIVKRLRDVYHSRHKRRRHYRDGGFRVDNILAQMDSFVRPRFGRSVRYSEWRHHGLTQNEVTWQNWREKTWQKNVKVQQMFVNMSIESSLYIPQWLIPLLSFHSFINHFTTVFSISSFFLPPTLSAFWLYYL